MANEHFLAQLWATIESRKAEAGPEKSYTRELLANPSKARKKVAEEAHEVNEAHQALLAGHDSKDHLAHEAADLIYHLFVVLASADVTPAEVYAVLESRHGRKLAGAAKVP
jgi:phosphoribosyl-ATP pyrophosphohydrolase